MRLPWSPKADVVHVHLAEDGAFIREGALVVFARLLGRPTVVTIHGANFLEFAQRHPQLAGGVLRRAHAITCLDAEVLDVVRRMAPDAWCELMPNPVMIDDDSPDVGQTDELVLFAGEIGLRKGVDVLCRAWQTVSEARPHARCIMVGPVRDFDVPAMERLEVCAPVDASGIRALIRAARVVVLPSRSEGMPMILTEAMSGGRPFVSTDVGGISELAEGGILVGVDDDAALATQIVSLLADPALARNIGCKGQAFCRSTRSTDVISDRLERVYLEANERQLRPSKSAGALRLRVFRRLNVRR